MTLTYYTKPVIAILLCVVASCGKNKESNTSIKTPPTIFPRIVGIIHHDSTAFTQGLLFHDGSLYESTGLYGKSSLRKIDPGTGKVLKLVPVPDVFGEGLALCNGSLVQLTWREGVAIVYELAGLRPLSSFKYSGEGWGLTADTKLFYMSNGSDTIYFRDRGFNTVGKLAIRFMGKPLSNLNELEYVQNRLFANVWYSDCIFEISLTNGSVTRVINCSAIVQQEQPLSEDAVLNGIAYDSQSDEFFITGKNWRHIYRVKIPLQH